MPTDRRPSFPRALLIFSAFCVLILMPPEAARNITEHPRLTILWVILYLGFFGLIIAWGQRLYRRYDHFNHRSQSFFAHAKTLLGGYLAIVAGEIVLGSLNRLIYHQVQTANNQAIIDTMSGSPIVQDGKLVGAVTHVLLDDPQRGYGILAENMLSASGMTAQSAASA